MTPGEEGEGWSKEEGGRGDGVQPAGNGNGLVSPSLAFDTRGAGSENSQDGRANGAEVMEQLQRCNLPPKVYFSAGCGLLWRPEIAGRLGGTRSAA